MCKAGLLSTLRSVSLGTVDSLGQRILCRGGSCVLKDVEHHPWSLPTRCQQHPLLKLWHQTLSKVPWGCKIAPSWEQLLCKNSLVFCFLSFLGGNKKFTLRLSSAFPLMFPRSPNLDSHSCQGHDSTVCILHRSRGCHSHRRRYRLEDLLGQFYSSGQESGFCSNKIAILWQFTNRWK